MKKIIILLGIILISIPVTFFTACGDDDDENEADNSPVYSSITKAELESTPSFCYSKESLYIKFRDGKLYTQNYLGSSSYNNDTLTYELSGKNIKLTFYYTRNAAVVIEGTIYKYVKKGESDKLVLSLDQKKKVGKWLSKEFEWSTRNF